MGRTTIHLKSVMIDRLKHFDVIISSQKCNDWKHFDEIVSSHKCEELFFVVLVEVDVRQLVECAKEIFVVGSAAGLVRLGATQVHGVVQDFVLRVKPN
jgi:hypothetical protein